MFADRADITCNRPEAQLQRGTAVALLRIIAVEVHWFGTAPGRVYERENTKISGRYEGFANRKADGAAAPDL